MPGLWASGEWVRRPEHASVVQYRSMFTDDDEYAQAHMTVAEDRVLDACLFLFAFTLVTLALISRSDGEAVLEWVVCRGPNPCRVFARKYGRLRLFSLVASGLVAAALVVLFAGGLRAFAVFDARRLTDTKEKDARVKTQGILLFVCLAFGALAALMRYLAAAAEKAKKRRRAAADDASWDIELTPCEDVVRGGGAGSEYEGLVRSPDYFFEDEPGHATPHRRTSQARPPAELSSRQRDAIASLNLVRIPP